MLHAAGALRAPFSSNPFSSVIVVSSVQHFPAFNRRYLFPLRAVSKVNQPDVTPFSSVASPVICQ